MRDPVIQRKLRWGILGTAGIARVNWNAIRHSENSTLVAVASRDLTRASQFIRECQATTPFPAAPAAFASYEDLLAAPEVDAVYVPLPTASRQEWIVRAAQAGKHVLCEKPCAVSAANLEEMLGACRGNGVQFMDGVKFMHHPRLVRVREALDDNEKFGEVRRVASSFCFHGTEEFFRSNIRVSGNLEPAGCLGDLGWYCIRFSLWAMGWRMPDRVSGQILTTASAEGGAPVPAEFRGELAYADGTSASFYSSFRTASQQWVHVSGDRGWLRMDDFVLPPDGETSLTTSYGIVRIPDAGLEGTQQTNMFRRFADQVLSGKLNEEWPEWARRTQQVMDACLRPTPKSN
jgi:predicted dehydrogenase